MTSVANLQPEPAPILACTISRDVQNFELLIDDMEQELGENWGDLSFEDALIFLEQPEGAALKFVAVAVDAQDEADLSRISDIIRTAKARNIRVVNGKKQARRPALHAQLVAWISCRSPVASHWWAARWSGGPRPHIRGQ